MLAWLLQRLRPPARPPRQFAQDGFLAFVTYVDEAQRVRADERLYSNRASARLRVLIPAQELARRVPVWLVAPQELAERPNLAHLGKPGAVVLGKLAARDVLTQRGVLRLLLQNVTAGALSAPFYADLSDDYAALGKEMHQPFLGEYQQALGRCATFIVPCAALGEALVRDARRGVVVIEDPYETPAAGEVRAAASAPLRLAWFGSLGSVNLVPLEHALDVILSSVRDRAIELEVVTANQSAGLVLAMRERLRARHPNLELRFIPWSLGSTEAALERSDFVLLPQEYRTDWGKVKSHNRMVSVIRAGRLAIASPIPAYRELADYAWVGDDLGQGLRWAIAHPDEARQRVTEGQRYIETRFAPQAIGDKWAAALGIP